MKPHADDPPDGLEPDPVLVSACLMGRPCRYDGRHNRDAPLLAHLETRGERAVPFCPEEEGGLGTPRPAAWIILSELRSVRPLRVLDSSKMSPSRSRRCIRTSTGSSITTTPLQS